MRKEGLNEILVLAGGVIPEEDKQILEEHGVASIFGPGTPTRKIIEYIKGKLA
jgi:methylmalonyl-CoA mutase C-terminal domain/subunit